MNIYKNTLMAMFLIIGATTFAQQGYDEQDKKDRIEAMRISFITQRLDLSPEEAQKFWPVYNQYRKELEKIKDKEEDGSHHRGRPDIDAMTDKEVKVMMEAEMARHGMLLDLRKSYFDQFLKVLPVKKVAKLYEAEKDFQRQLIRKLSDHQREKRQ